ncbi:hypothetical protein JCGZ_09528 [Jatropha curcas]|uniref:C2H2-type domain-containing protein n=1 Tax=Jatropha curcas TaxID=180498 RepID=A0A067KMV5_JATCU|nr:zinc finger protein ZAT5 [Jatropha curcas]KDP36313.1 hypothetical protein JCGZ_09528 [Jatropha curcas]
MYMNVTSSVSTDSYYGRRTKDFDSTADSKDCFRSLPSTNLTQSLPSDWSGKRKRSSSSSLNQELLQKVSFLLLQSMSDAFNETNISEVLQDMIKRSKDLNRRNDVVLKEEGDMCSGFSDTDTANSEEDKRKKRKKLSELVGLKSSSYVCKECNKVFDDFRALGGHIAAHNRNKRAAAAGDGVDSILAAEAGVFGEVKKYACNLCSRSFTTGQALGGHKTYHRKIGDCDGEVEDEAVSGSLATSEEEKNAVFLALDLNAPPPYERPCGS